MSCDAKPKYTGEDDVVVIDLKGYLFSDLQDMIVGIVVNKTLVKTCKKSSLVAATQIIEHPDDPTFCLFRIFRSETKLWSPGPMVLEVTFVYADAEFPAGRHSTGVAQAAIFKDAKTKAA